MKNKLILKSIISLLALAAFSTACDSTCERGEGRIITQTFNMTDFSGIELSAWGDVEIIQSAEHKVEITAQPNVIDRFNLHVRQKTLRVGADCFNTGKKPQLKIYCSSLNKLHFSGAGNVYSKGDFESENFDLKLSGSGDVELKGKTEDLSVTLSGSGNIDLSDLASKSCDIKVSGSGDCKVNVSEYLDVKISGSGKVYYTGYPEIEQKVSGSGSVTSNN